MNNPFILPTRSLRLFFGIALREDCAPDLTAIKNKFPAVYWQLPASIVSSKTVSPQSVSSQYEEKRPAAVTVNELLIQQRLWLGDDLFSQVIATVTDDCLTLYYVQLLPPSPPHCGLINHRYRHKFARKYRHCLQRTLLNLEALARASGIVKINVALLNPALVEIFQCMGYAPVTSPSSNCAPRKSQSALHVMDKFALERLIPHPAITG